MDTYELKESHFFRFEEDFVEANIRCIPMIVRFKLDACGIKLRLAEWSKMSPQDREYLSTAPCCTPAETAHYRDHLVSLIAERAGTVATSIPVAEAPDWSRVDEIPNTVMEKVAECRFELSLTQWQRLTDLQRFALLKLSRSGHENKNFPRAMAEFGLTTRSGVDA